MDLIVFAGPFFALFILAELLLDWRRGTGYYRLNDAVGSLSMGILSTASKLVIYGVEAAILLRTGEHLVLWQVPADSALLLTSIVYLWQTAIGAVALFYPAYGLFLAISWTVLRRPREGQPMPAS